MQFSVRLKCLIMHNGCTQKRIAKELCVSESAVSRWVRGISEPSMDKLVVLSRLFHISLDDLIIGKLLIDDLLQERYANKIVEQTKLDL